MADAGEDIIAYADWSGKASVTLDGSGSSDEDGDELTYSWTWSINGADYQAEGVNPMIELPPGEHTITLVVNDGQADSKPDEVVVTVLEMMQAEMVLTPQSLNPTSQGRWIKAHFILPEGYTIDDVDTDTPATLYPAGITSDHSEAFVNEDGFCAVEIAFQRGDVAAKLTENGEVALHVLAHLTGGVPFYGTDTIGILDIRWEKMLGLSSHWLEAVSGGKDKGGYDIDGDSNINLIDLALMLRTLPNPEKN
jgi:hypothetical protein